MTSRQITADRRYLANCGVSFHGLTPEQVQKTAAELRSAGINSNITAPAPSAEPDSAEPATGTIRPPEESLKTLQPGPNAHLIDMEQLLRSFVGTGADITVNIKFHR